MALVETRSAVVYVPGVFDLFHRGHAALLERARCFGTRLVVGVVTDEFAEGYKRRPAQNERERARAVSTLGAVPPEDVILVARDHGEVCLKTGARILVHGDDWPMDSYLDLLKYDETLKPLGVSVFLVPSTPDVSTTALLAGGAPRALAESAGKVVALDLDGTLVGQKPREGAREFVHELVELGARPVVVTNNNFMSPCWIRNLLVDSGFDEAIEVVSSLAVAAERVAEERVYVWGSFDSESWLSNTGISTTKRPDDADVILLLHKRDFFFSDLTRLCGAVKAGVPYLVGNIDSTYPDEEVTIPDTGSLAALVKRATGRAPRGVLGKPFAAFPASFDAREICAVVGDTNETDGRLAEELGVPFVDVSGGWMDTMHLVRAIRAGRVGTGARDA